ncbi:hypothetical protein AOLI_G00243190 [Acnodon oligacanthus]
MMSVQIASSAYMAFLTDGDTDIAPKERVIVYSRILQRGRPVKVEHAHAQGIYAASEKVFAAPFIPTQWKI